MQKILLLLTIFICAIGCKENDLEFISNHIDPMSKITSEPERPISDQADEVSDEAPAKKPISCKKYCKKNHFAELEDDGFSYLSFTNFGYRGIGRCRGHALLTQKMTVLASFDKTGGCELENPECLKTYREGIQKIKRFKHHKFYGFKNLFEFSSHPKIKYILRGIVAGTSNRYKASAGYIKNPVYDTKELNTFYEVKRRLALGQLPYIGVLGPLTGAHALVLYADTYSGAQNILCAKDPNYRSDRAESCENYFFEQDGEIYFQRLGRAADKMLRFSLTSDEDRRVKRYKSALNQQCIEVSQAAKLCD